MTRSRTKEVRRYLRHPAQVPVVCRLEGHSGNHQAGLRNISFGGMAFVCGSSFEPGDLISTGYPTLDVRGLRGEVVWSDTPDDDTHRCMCGIKFLEGSMFLRARMIEQLCCMEVYRRAQCETRGRRISRNEAAQEWIAKTARHFQR